MNGIRKKEFNPSNVIKIQHHYLYLCHTYAFVKCLYATTRCQAWIGLVKSSILPMSTNCQTCIGSQKFNPANVMRIWYHFLYPMSSTANCHARMKSGKSSILPMSWKYSTTFYIPVTLRDLSVGSLFHHSGSHAGYPSVTHLHQHCTPSSQASQICKLISTCIMFL